MTYSIVARDPTTGELGIAVQSRFFAAGRIVPWIEAGVGVIASQSFASPTYGYDGLRLLTSGMSPQETLSKLVHDDPGAALRQVAILDVQGRVAAHTGTQCVAAAGHAVGADCCAQANMMLRDTVWQAMVYAFEHNYGDLAERLVGALEAAEREGGDVRGAQAAALLVVSGTSSGVAKLDRLVDLRIDDHPTPVPEIRRLLAYSRTHTRAHQALAKLFTGDPTGALADLDTCCTAFPHDPEFLCLRAVILVALDQTHEAREMVLQASAIYPGWGEFLRRFADAGILPLHHEQLAPLMTAPTSAG